MVQIAKDSNAKVKGEWCKMYREECMVLCIIVLGIIVYGTTGKLTPVKDFKIDI